MDWGYGELDRAGGTGVAVSADVQKAHYLSEGNEEELLVGVLESWKGPFWTVVPDPLLISLSEEEGGVRELNPTSALKRYRSQNRETEYKPHTRRETTAKRDTERPTARHRYL